MTEGSCLSGTAGSADMTSPVGIEVAVIKSLTGRYNISIIFSDIAPLYRLAQKSGTLFVRLITSSDIDQVSNFFSLSQLGEKL